MTKHVDYPHEAGRLYDCLACESECYCGNRTPPGDNPSCCGLPSMLPGSCHTQCIHCDIMDMQTMIQRHQEQQIQDWIWEGTRGHD